MQQIRLLYDFVSQKHIYKPIIIIFLFSSAPSTGDAFFFFYTNKLGFSKEMMGRLNFVGVLASVLGVIYLKRFYTNTLSNLY